MKIQSVNTGKKRLSDCDNEELIEIVSELQIKLERRKLELHKAKTKLSSARSKLVKLKDTVVYQRKRILELYP